MKNKEKIVFQNTLDLKNSNDLNRLKQLFDNYYAILDILNQDSNNSIAGGGHCDYTVEIKIKEEWT